MDEKHHLVPEFYLRGFAEGTQIGLVDRDLRKRFVTSGQPGAQGGRRQR